MRIHEFESTTAFVAIDLDGGEASSGPVRWARKILQGGAQDLARSQTYTFAALGMRRGGASAGISAEAADRDAAVAAFTGEVAALVDAGTYLPDAAKGVTEADLAALRADDPRDVARLGGGVPTLVDRCEGLSAAVCAHHTMGGLAGRTVAIEGFGPNGPALAEAAVERGAKVIAVSTSTGTVTNPGGFDVAALAEAWRDHGDEVVAQLGEPEHAKAIFGAGADVIFAGSKMGVVDHGVAAQLEDAAAVVACGRLPLTAKALATLRKAGVAAPADFVALAGPTLALWGDVNRTEPEILAGVNEEIADLSTEIADHDDGPMLGACLLAEDYLKTWLEELPFGRPLAP